MELPVTLFEPEKIKGKCFVVFGDFMLDHYRFMQPKKLSPEAPVVIFSQVSEEYRLGGAGNVANNLVALGGEVDFFSIVGHDWPVYENKVKVPFNAHIMNVPKPVTVKERILTKRQQVARIDRQMTAPLNALDVNWILSHATESIRRADIVVVSDYNHGTMVEDLAIRVIALARKLGKKVIVDSKAPDSITKYKGATMIVPNEAEACLIAGKSSLSESFAEDLVNRMDLEAIGITMGPKGIFLYYDGKGELIPACLKNEDEVADVTGAGDTVLASLAAALACGADYRTATIFANEAASQVVRKVGVATVELSQLNSERSVG
jgi:D-beta-D-heptose 7-phosphate kinase/D-beta-D-heptose 1-phosphate adenosyltransferase